LQNAPSTNPSTPKPILPQPLPHLDTHQGEQLPDVLRVPRLRLRKNWFVGIKGDPVDHSHPDVGGAGMTFEQRVKAGKVRRGLGGGWWLNLRRARGGSTGSCRGRGNTPRANHHPAHKTP